MRASLLISAPAVVLAGLVAAFVGAVEPLPVAAQPVKRPPIGRPGTTTAVPITDEEALKKAGIKGDDGTKLIEYLKLRTLTDSEQGRINAIIKRFGADDFDERVKATEEIEAFGPAAVVPLKTAERDSDPEVAYRAKLALKRVETVPHSAVAAAAVRAVVKLKPAGAAAALIGFLPLADDDTVVDSIQQALVALAVGTDGKAEPSLLAALADASPVRRAAVYQALIDGGPASGQAKDAYVQVRAAVLKDADPEARFVGLWAMTLTAREKEFMPELIAMVPKLNRGRIWQLEDLLLQLAGTHPKDGRFMKSPESREKARDAWLAWWKEKGDKLDFAKTEYKPRITGVTDIIEMDIRGYGTGRVVCLGPDMKEKWKLTGVNNPYDMKVAANGNIFVVESNTNQVTERTPANAVVNRRTVQAQPMTLALLPNGGQLIVCRNNVYEFAKDAKPTDNALFTYTRQNYDILTGCRLPGGDTLVVFNNGQPVNCVRLDAKLKETGKSYSFGRVQNLQGMDVTGEESVLVCEWDKVAEYDLKTGKQTWKFACNNASCCQRLPNGNTLITVMNQNQVLEVDPSGEVVWEYRAKDGLRVARAYRR